MEATGTRAVAATERISFLTDVEGDWDYLCRFVAISEALSLDGDGSLVLADGWRFVFGGDVVDKAPGSLRCVKALVQMKRAYPDRVVLLLGNRDINKMRFTSELHSDEIAAVHDVPGPFWVDADQRVPPLDFVKQAAAKAEGLQSIDQVDAPDARALQYEGQPLALDAKGHHGSRRRVRVPPDRAPAARGQR